MCCVAAKQISNGFVVRNRNRMETAGRGLQRYCSLNENFTRKKCTRMEKKNEQRENNHSGCVAGIYSPRIRDDDDTRRPECVFQIRCRPSLVLVVFSLLFFSFIFFRPTRDSNTYGTNTRTKTQQTRREGWNRRQIIIYSPAMAVNPIVASDSWNSFPAVTGAHKP